MPGFAGGVELARENGFVEKVGVHLNITQGMPLTSAIRRVPMFCAAGGQFCYSRRTLRHLNREAKRCLEEELLTQIEQCRRAGLSLDHADSHHHFHTDIGALGVVAHVLKISGIRRLRASANVGVCSRPKSLAKAFFNAGLRVHGLQSTAVFGDWTEFLKLESLAPYASKTVELAIHPALREGDRRLIDRIAGIPLAPALLELRQSLGLLEPAAGYNALHQS